MVFELEDRKTKKHHIVRYDNIVTKEVALNSYSRPEEGFHKYYIYCANMKKDVHITNLPEMTVMNPCGRGPEDIEPDSALPPHRLIFNIDYSKVPN